MGGGWGCGQSSFPTGPRVDAENTGPSWYEDVVNQAIEDARNESGPDATDMKAGDIDVFPVDASTAPDVVPPPEKKVVPWDKMTVDPVSIAGELQQLAAGRRQVDGVTEKGCFAVSSHPGQFGKAPQLTLFFVSGSSNKATLLGEIADAFDSVTGQARFNVNSLFQNNEGDLVFAVQSTGGTDFNVDGSVHQLLVANQDGTFIGQYDFLNSTSPNFRPQVVVQGASGEQFVLLNNCEPEAVFTKDNFYIPCQQSSAIAVFQKADFSDQPVIIPLLGAKNGGAATLVDDLLIVAAAGNVHMDPTSTGQLLMLSATNLGKTTSNTTGISFPGVGLGSTQVSYRNGVTLFTVNNSPWKPAEAKPGVVLLDNEQMVALPLPPKLVFVAGAVFAGDNDVLFSGHDYDAATKLSTTDVYRSPLDQATLVSTPLQEKPMPSWFSIGVVEYDDTGYCYGAAGTEKTAEGTLYSTVMMVHP